MVKASLGRVAIVAMASMLGAQAHAQTPEETARAAETAAETAAALPAAPAAPTAADATSDQAVREQLAALAEPGGLTADAAASAAIDTAPSMRSAEAAVVAAEAGARAAWQNLFPRLELSARYTRLSPVTQPDFGSIGLSPEDAAMARILVDGVDDPEANLLWTSLINSFSSTDGGFSFPVILNQYAFRATASYPVSDLFFTILPGYRAAETATEARRAQTRVEHQQIGNRAREAYYALARARGGMTVAQKAVEQSEAHLRQVEILVEAGAAAPVERLRLQAQVAQARLQVANAQAGVALSEHALRSLMHDESNGHIAIGEDFSVPPPEVEGDLSALTDRALRQRPEMLALEALVEARERALRVDLGRRYPQLLVQANVDVANPNQRIIPQRERFDTTWDLSVILRWSPNEFGQARQRVEQARAELLQVRADIDALRDGIRLEVAQHAAQLEAARVAYEASVVALRAAHEAYRVRRSQLEAGAAVTSDVIDADADLTRARLGVVDAAIQLRLTHRRLLNALGE